MRVRSTRRGGYTLIELVIVLVILGVLAAVAAPSLSGWMIRWQMGAALDRFQGDYWYARALAARSGRRVELRFVPSSASECIASYQIVVSGSSEWVTRDVAVGEQHPRLCVRQNRDVAIRIDSRGLPTTSAARSLWVRHGSMVDSLTLSMLGGVNRRH